MELFEKQTGTRLIFDGKIIQVREDTVLLQNGETAVREVTHHSGGVMVAAVTPERQVYVVRQFRYPYGEVLTEFPAGKLEPGEDPLEAGLRELQEEVGVRAETLYDMGKLYPTAAYNDEVIHMYLATEFQQGEQNLDDDEFLEVSLVDIRELAQMVMRGEIRDAKTQTAALKLYCHYYGGLSF